MCTVFPEIVDPDWEIELETITAIKAGSGPGGGGGLLPGSVDQLVPQVTDAGAFSKPLKADGAEPPLNVFSFPHCAPQKVTGVPNAAFPSPITKVPPATVAKTRTGQDAEAVDPPSSMTLIVTVNVPVDAYVWLPLTTNGPPVGPVTVPAELLTSPQSIFALKSDATPNGLASVRFATASPVKEMGSVAELQVAASAASPTVAVEVAIAELKDVSGSVIFTVTVNVPSSA